MRYDPEKTYEKLKHVPIRNRSFIYDATIILEFLDQTLMPIEFFSTPEGKEKLSEARLTLGDLYEYYKMFRQQKEYTSPIESRYKFSVILKKLLITKNGWQFEVKRVGRAQLIYFSPALLRVKVDPVLRRKFLPAKQEVKETQIEVTKEDHEEKVPTDKEVFEQEHVGEPPIEPDTNDPSQFPAEGRDVTDGF